jgi:hypothetical protein
MGVTVDDGHAEDVGRRLVILVVSDDLRADADIPDHAAIVSGRHLVAHDSYMEHSR